MVRQLSSSLSISIHALREEGDATGIPGTKVLRNFYPRPPRGGRHRFSRFLRGRESHFYPRPPRGGRQSFCFAVFVVYVISIHALREEGDFWSSARFCGASVFLSTPSARRATSNNAAMAYNSAISIHALREEGDCGQCTGCKLRKRFLSTPSARRATAKTETKSLFSNKLYNILHEFRRALIYNGSKNYPNHAK